MNRRPKSSNVRPNWAPPSAASQASPSGRNRKSVRFSSTGGRSGARGRDDLAAGQAAGEVDPVVDREGRVADAELGAPGRREAGEEDPALVGLAVAVGVAEVEDVRGAGDDQAALPGHDAVGEGRAPRRTRSGGPSGRRRRCLPAGRSGRPAASPRRGRWGSPRFSATNSRPRSSKAIATGLTTIGSAATSSTRRPGSSRNAFAASSGVCGFSGVCAWAEGLLRNSNADDKAMMAGAARCRSSMSRASFLRCRVITGPRRSARPVA